jgi:hypothetical protein
MFEKIIKITLKPYYKYVKHKGIKTRWNLKIKIFGKKVV